MKATSAILSLLLILAILWLGFYRSMPVPDTQTEIPDTDFSVVRAMEHVRNMSQQPHAVGFPAHKNVRNYIQAELEKMGLHTQLQSGYTAGDWGNLSKAVNILARIKGTGDGKALLLLSHYDSSPHSSLGASDAASGVATILESVRAMQSRQVKFKNDIIILITDAEELGLNGADLFVNRHPWAKEVGLALNFEARGSGGPSYMLIETNRGNRTLIDEFVKAAPDYPVANSLAYSIYKMLPNDTDLTIFREDGDIEGFNFAFIDDHFDYHTANDRYERLDWNTLAHQGSYLMPLMSHFGDADLSGLKSLNNSIYFNVPFFKLVTYPYEWMIPLLVLTLLFFLFLISFGLYKKKLSVKGIGMGFLAILLSLIGNAVLGYFAWPLLQSLYPHYKDILHGFTYNGYYYIGVWVALSISVCFLVYSRFKKIPIADLLIGPLILWIILSAASVFYLDGASFIIIPVIAALFSLFIFIKQENPNPYIQVLLTIPALWIFGPFIKMFPVGLGLKLLISVSVLITLVFGLILSVLGRFPSKSKYATLFGILALGFFIGAHFASDFTEDRPRPNSLLYVYDADEMSAKWATYDHVLSDWTSNYISSESTVDQSLQKNTLSSKYSTGFTFTAPATDKNIPIPEWIIKNDTLLGQNRYLELEIRSNRPVNRLEIFDNGITFEEVSVNGIPLSDYYLKNRGRNKLITHYVSDSDSTVLQLTYPSSEILELQLFEASNDLLTHPGFTVPQRPATDIPKPFVLNDAIVVLKRMKFE